MYRRRSLNHEGIDRDARPRSGIIAIVSICIRFVAEATRIARRTTRERFHGSVQITHFNDDDTSDFAPFHTRRTPHYITFISLISPSASPRDKTSSGLHITYPLQFINQEIVNDFYILAARK